MATASSPPSCSLLAPVAGESVIDFHPPPPTSPLRTRRAAHLVDDEYVARFAKAISLMKSLPKDDPRNFYQQANVHCAYCDDGCKLPFPTNTNVHRCWLFFPWHRCYLYFYERILGNLIGDPTFALPFWNWDAIPGMEMASIFTSQSSPLWNRCRNDDHQPPALLDLSYNLGDPNPKDEARLYRSNGCLMNRQMVTCAKKPSLFFGTPPSTEFSGSAGTIECSPHNNVHNWTGDPTQRNRGEDMGIFYSAARDPIFFAHHANVDRMWTVWKTLPGGTRKDIEDQAWLNTEFYFYDEDKSVVRIKVSDCLDIENLGYVYEDIPIPWKNSKPTPTMLRKRSAATSESTPPFPIILEKITTAAVSRPARAISRSKEEKEKEEEVLVIEGIEYDKSKYLCFDVLINYDDIDLQKLPIGPESTEFAGRFVTVPSKNDGKKNYKECFRIGITELLEVLEADDHQIIGVTLVPKSTDRVTISEIRIVLVEE